MTSLDKITDTTPAYGALRRDYTCNVDLGKQTSALGGVWIRKFNFHDANLVAHTISGPLDWYLLSVAPQTIGNLGWYFQRTYRVAHMQ